MKKFASIAGALAFVAFTAAAWSLLPRGIARASETICQCIQDKINCVECAVGVFDTRLEPICPEGVSFVQCSDACEGENTVAGAIACEVTCEKILTSKLDSFPFGCGARFLACARTATPAECQPPD